ncbi:MAG: dockerin type I repeat-containing protein [Clostridia bacterium]|nr:dockerin type I repeat-containing protein [Clostridia bacterium]
MGKLKTLTAFLVGIVLVTVGFALNTFSATTPPQASDGYYELDSYEDLVWFQQYVDAGNLEINARLTADIVANENLLNDKGSLNGTPSNVWTPIGRNFTFAANSYNGILDGAGHSITGLFFYDTKGAGYYGLFAKMGRGTVKNLAIVDSFFGGVNKSNYVGTFVGEGYAVNLENCYSNAIIYASDYYGGIVGKTSVANIRNCLYAGTFRILGSSIYADPIVKKNSTDNSIRVYNCYYKGDCGLNSTVATAVATNGLASGQVTYLLNRNQSSDVWRQNIDIGEKDSEPTLDTNHHIVFYNGNTYTNYCNVHSWSDGICSVCGLICTHEKYENGVCSECSYSVEEPQLVDDYYEIANYGNLIWFQRAVDAGNVNINARLTSNIAANENLLDSSGNVQGTPKYNWTPIGRGYSNSSDSYNGIFDGAGYSISGLYSKGTGLYCGFFGQVNKGTIKNLSIVDSYFGENSCYYVGTFVGYSYGNIENCYSNATIVGLIYCGGIAGTMKGTISDCLYNGKIKGTDNSNAIASDRYNYGTITNCYYKENCGLSSSRATSVTDEQLASGEVAYLLNGDYSAINWYQNIDKGEKDKLPTLNSEHYKVYKGENIYTNDINKHSHIYNNGICNICNKACTHGKYENGICSECNYGVEEPQLVDGYYEISSYGNLIWFQRYVDAGNININAKLTADIVANENLLDSSGNVQGTPKYNWVPIGIVYSSSSDSYNGIFDGADYSISGLYTNSTGNICGFFGQVNNGTIKNLSIVDSYFGGNSCMYAGTFVAYDWNDGNIENCYSNATIVGQYFCGGVAGRTRGTVSNCLYNGKIKGFSYSNAIVSDTHNYGTITNCYYNENCGKSSSRATSVTDEQLASGEVAYLLNGDQSDIKWYQNIDKGEKDNVPTLNSAHYTVFKNSNGYSNTLLGDVNNDGKIDRKDAVLILKNISGITSDNFSAENADYNGDGAINSLDAIAIMKSI